MDDTTTGDYDITGYNPIPLPYLDFLNEYPKLQHLAYGWGIEMLLVVTRLRLQMALDSKDLLRIVFKEKLASSDRRKREDVQ
jgi:hypothetical protein